MATRQQYIEQVAGIVAESIIPWHVAYDEHGRSAEEIAYAVNVGEGWSFELPAALPDNWIVVSGARLAEEELGVAVSMGERWANGDFGPGCY